MSIAQSVNQTRRQARVLTAVVSVGVVLALLLLLLVPGVDANASRALAPTASTCATTKSTRHASTNLATVAEAYTCVLTHYPSAAGIDDQVLLHGAMDGIAGYLVQQGFDQNNAVLPALTGDAQADWHAFAASYAAIAQRLPRTQIPVQQGLAPAAIGGLVASLHDDHAHYVPSNASISGKGSAPTRVLGIQTSYVASFSRAPRTPNTPPLFITDVGAGTAAARAGLRPGDIIQAINGLPPYSDEQANAGVISLLDLGSSVSLTIRRPATRRTFHVRVTPTVAAAPATVSARVLAGTIAYVRLHQFVPHVSNQVFAAIHHLNLGRRLSGMVLDMRGNPGGDAAEPPRLLGAFVHNATFAIYDAQHRHVTRVPVDNSVPLLHVPLVALVDGQCASACDATAAAIHDLHLGRLVGQRTEGAVSGPASLFYLNDGSALELPTAAMRGPNGETVDGVGVPPDDPASLTPAALSAGHDAAIDRAVQDVRGMHDPMIDIGGFRLHLHCTGTGSPTVVLDSGAGDDWTAWNRVQPALSRTTRVCSYDRAGNGLSDFGLTPRTSGRMVAELRTLLARAHIPGPYVLVGWSLGGTNMQLYTFTHAAEVRGLVLVDTAKQGAKPATVGKPRAGVTAGKPVRAGGSTQTATITGAGGEEGNVVQTDYAELASAQHRLGSLPLIVLTHAAPTPSLPHAVDAAQLADAQRQDAQIAHLSTNSEQILALRSGHYIQQDQPGVVIDAIREVVTAARQHILLPHHGQVLRKG